MSRCARCGADFGCGARESSCWCASVALPPPVLEQLAETYRDCLCPDCLAAHAGARATS